MGLKIYRSNDKSSDCDDVSVEKHLPTIRDRVEKFPTEKLYL